MILHMGHLPENFLSLVQPLICMTKTIFTNTTARSPSDLASQDFPRETFIECPSVIVGVILPFEAGNVYVEIQGSRICCNFDLTEAVNKVPDVSANEAGTGSKSYSISCATSILHPDNFD